MFLILTLLLQLAFSAEMHLEPTSRPVDTDETKYYMVVMATQDGQTLRFPKLKPIQLLTEGSESHTFATFLNVKGKRVIEEITISWMPKSDYLESGNTMPREAVVPGKNYSLDETLSLLKGKSFQHYGAYPISEELFKRAKSRISFLNQGRTAYKMALPNRTNALHNKPGGAINCIIAVSDLGGYLDTGVNYGFNASYLVLKHLERSGLISGPRDDTAIKYLNLEERRK